MSASVPNNCFNCGKVAMRFLRRNWRSTSDEKTVGRIMLQFLLADSLKEELYHNVATSFVGTENGCISSFCGVFLPASERASHERMGIVMITLCLYYVIVLLRGR